MINVMIKGLMGAFLRSGVKVHRLDLKKYQLYINLPDKSYVYDEDPYLTNGEDYAKRIKDLLIQWHLFPETGQVKFKIRPTMWSKSDGKFAWDVDGWKARKGTLWEGKIVGL